MRSYIVYVISTGQILRRCIGTETDMGVDREALAPGEAIMEGEACPDTYKVVAGRIVIKPESDREPGQHHFREPEE